MITVKEYGALQSKCHLLVIMNRWIVAFLKEPLCLESWMKILSLSVALLHHIQSHWQALDILNIYCDISSCIVINVSFVTVVYSYWIDQLLYFCHCYHSHTLMFMIWGNYRVSYKNARNFLKSWHFCLQPVLRVIYPDCGGI